MSLHGFRKERLRVARKKKKLTMEQLAKLVNTTKGTISNYENGHSSPPNEMLSLLSDKLDVSADWLLGRTDNPAGTSQQSEIKLSKEDERDIAIRMAKLREDLIEGRDTGGLSYLGKQISEEAIESILASLEHAERMVTLIEKREEAERKKKTE